jgi:hypothetical protein
MFALAAQGDGVCPGRTSGVDDRLSQGLMSRRCPCSHLRVADWRFAGYPWGVDAGVMSDRLNCGNADSLELVDSE